MARDPAQAATAPFEIPSLASATWLRSPALVKVFGALAAGGYEARVVGGAVRNALLGQPVRDVDLAITATPEEAMRAVASAGLAAIPTGIEHGTITVVSNHVPFEVTTLRRDVETFGRRARVTYTTDWVDDARRRDFTINALYCSADGTIHDPLGGYRDLHARRIRFIGSAVDRIREDYLRILRFFRFTAEYADGEPDAEGLAACIREQAGMDALSGERIRAEILKLLIAPGAVPTTAAMARAGVLARALGGNPDVGTFTRLAEIEAATGRSPDPLLRLAALVSPWAAWETETGIADRLKLSGAERTVLASADTRDTALHAASAELLAKAHIYRHGTKAFVAATLLHWARSGDPADHPRWHARLELAERFPPPVLPVSGRDVLALGITAGPDVGRILATFEAWWIGADFPTDPAQSAAKLCEIAAAKTLN
ncbi:MAG: CCA tRNA nucleotidyltransferase [Hyphomicrobium sp.]|nr:CCA tRNA nucleotidyltransferase [Hyphomicrobium sp.]PPC83976.1 MAG: polynucleotide adenylyltransferase [Hyphomicrobium sp.]